MSRILVEARKNFNIYRIPKKVNKQQFMVLEEFKENPKPISAAFYPYVLQNPKVGTKKYYWCSCGLSTKQPFCDYSHKPTSFKPIEFTIQEKVDQVSLCLCKLSSQAPYCDGVACLHNKRTIE